MSVMLPPGALQDNIDCRLLTVANLALDPDNTFTSYTIVELLITELELKLKPNVNNRL